MQTPSQLLNWRIQHLLLFMIKSFSFIIYLNKNNNFYFYFIEAQPVLNCITLNKCHALIFFVSPKEIRYKMDTANMPLS